MQETLSYHYGQKIGSGLNGDVYHYYEDEESLASAQQQQQLVIKVFKTALEYKQEEEALSQLDHPNIIKIVKRQENKMLLKYYQNGDLFDFLQGPGQKIISEPIARYFFKQLLEAVEHIHSKGIVHRDIKLENILIDEDFNLILSDFGLSTKVERGQLLNEYIGTSSYMAPEIVAQTAYYGQASDIFAMGVILFCLMVGTYPFQTQAVPTDSHYKYFSNKSYIRYWLLVEKQQQKNYSSGLKSLINSMLAYEMNERITLEEIWESEFMQGPIATTEEIREAINSLNQTNNE